MLLIAALSLAAADAVPPIQQLWNDLRAKRAEHASFHQEFEIEQTSRSGTNTQGSKRQTIIDFAETKWRRASISGSGHYVTIFNGSEMLTFEDGGEEFTRAKRKPKDGPPVPSPYDSDDINWAKSKEVERRPCELPGRDHTCVILEVTLKPAAEPSGSGRTTRRLEGTGRLLLDLQTGLLILRRSVQQFQNERSAWLSDTTYRLRRFSYGDPANAQLFGPPEGAKEVKELSDWNAARIKKQLAGKPAPDLSVTDIQGKPVRLTDLRGKTVLLDFWTTWCPPCRADGPSLDKLYKKFGAKELAIVGISVSEDRAIVEKFLSTHPHDFPIVLTSENEMPRAYQISVFPTYIVIDPDGNLSAAVEGDQGFGALQRLLKKAGLGLE
jgi:thiol-disulfide isomerase/thioredoxin